MRPSGVNDALKNLAISTGGFVTKSFAPNDIIKAIQDICI